MENKADKNKHKVNQSKYKQKKNMSNLYIGRFNSSIKEINIEELLGLNTTKYLRETCSLNMPLNDDTGQSKGYAFVSALKYVCDELLRLNEVAFYASQTKIELAKSTRAQTIVVSSPSKYQPVVANKNLEYKFPTKLTFSSLKTNCKAIQPLSPPHNTLIFTDSIRKGIRMYEFNSLL